MDFYFPFLGKRNLFYVPILAWPVFHCIYIEALWPDQLNKIKVTGVVRNNEA
jgi:hypothetical protein